MFAQRVTLTQLRRLAELNVRRRLVNVMNMYPPTRALALVPAPLATNHPLSPPVGSTLLSVPAVSRCLLVNIHQLAVTNTWELPGCFSMGLVTDDLSKNHESCNRSVEQYKSPVLKTIFLIDDLYYISCEEFFRVLWYSRNTNQAPKLQCISP